MEWVNTRTGAVLPIAHVHHWSWFPASKEMWVAPYEYTAGQAKRAINNFFDNRGHSQPLQIEVRYKGHVPSLPSGYNPASLPAFTHVYGKRSAVTECWQEMNKYVSLLGFY